MVCFQLVSCKCGNKPKNGINSIKILQVIHKPDKLENYIDIPKNESFTLSDSLWIGDTLICFNTYCINDSLSEIEVWEKLRWPIIKKQEIVVFNRGIRKGFYYFNFEKKERLNQLSKPIRCSKYIVREYCVFRLDKEIVISIPEAQDLCIGNYCSRFQALISLNGETIYRYFEIPDLKKGEIKQVLINHSNDTTFNQLANKRLSKINEKYGINFMDKSQYKCFKVLF